MWTCVSDKVRSTSGLWIIYPFFFCSLLVTALFNGQIYGALVGLLFIGVICALCYPNYKRVSNAKMIFFQEDSIDVEGVIIPLTAIKNIHYISRLNKKYPPEICRIFQMTFTQNTPLGTSIYFAMKFRGDHGFFDYRKKFIQVILNEIQKKCS